MRAPIPCAQLHCSLQKLGEERGATLLADHSGRGFGGPFPLPETGYAAGVHLLRFLDNTDPADAGATIAHVRLRLQSGTAIVTRVSTPFMEE